MTRVIVYSTALVALVAATAMTLTSILTPHWVSYSVGDSLRIQTTNLALTRTLGLHTSCTSTSSSTVCRPFPSDAECARDSSSFCSMWRTVGFLMSLAVILELAAVVGFVVILAGGKARRESGWKILGGLLGVVAVVLFSGMAVVAYLFDNNDRFVVPGWALDTSWILCTVSGTIAVLCALGLAISAYVLPPEDGYEFLGDTTGV